MLKTILLSICILLLTFIGYSQSEPSIELFETEVENTHFLTFENQREIDTNKMNRFTSRLEGYYEEVIYIDYNTEENSFKINFSQSPSELGYIDEFLTHFNIYNFTILK